MTIRSSQAAIDLIVTEEDSGEAYYTRHYTHFEWPLGASGPTAGIGYDCGYVTTAQIAEDWRDYVSTDMVSALQKAAGLKGDVAHQFVRLHGASVTITWDQAIAQFKGRELPKWEGIVSHALPNTNMLSGDSFGALVSLAYNRGYGGFTSPGPRFAEMRSIWHHMADKKFNLIPAEFLSMRRLWPMGKDLWNRRGHEAALFEKGLTCSPSV